MLYCTKNITKETCMEKLEIHKSTAVMPAHADTGKIMNMLKPIYVQILDD